MFTVLNLWQLYKKYVEHTVKILALRQESKPTSVSARPLCC